jgi:hypothetical protein
MRRNSGHLEAPTQMKPKAAEPPRLAAPLGALLLLLIAGCGGARPAAVPAAAPAAPIEAQIFRDRAPATGERTCAWYGDARGGVLYFGEAAFWSSYRASGGDPTADLGHPGPLWIGRFDLAAQRFLPPLVIDVLGARSGVWDVLAHPNGRVYFTSYFDDAGFVDPRSGESRFFPALGRGLNELALGPEGTLLASRYGAPGSVLLFDPGGRLLAEHRLAAPPGFRVAPKSVAWDPGRREIWVNTDLLPEAGGAVAHDARILDQAGHELLRIERPEVQFMEFAADGAGAVAELDGQRLELRLLPPGAPGAARAPGRVVLLDDAFPAGLDFVQDVKPAPDGALVVTRWSGRIHRVTPDGRVTSLDLPRTEPDALYYTAVQSDGRICATLCGDVEVVCRALPPAAGELR